MSPNKQTGGRLGYLTNIQKYTIHDGPGIRTELFFKGCPMSCLWCSNPETQCPTPELALYPDKCIGRDKCDLCRKTCPMENSPLRFDQRGIISTVDRLTWCAHCAACADACPSRAIKLWGQGYTVDELMQLILEDRSYYLKTGGGVTLNGGEVLVQWEFARELLQACKQAHIHTCVETAMHAPTSHLDAILPLTDLIITDIKHMDDGVHRSFAGCGNGLILDNIRHTAAMGVPMVIRTPVVPGYNGDEDSIRAIGAFLRDQLGGRVMQYQLLPYRKMGTEKYAGLGRPYPLEDYQPPARNEWEEELLRLSELLRQEYGIPAVAGSAHKLN